MTARPASAFPVRRPVPLILDTDMGNDVDDALALAMIHALQSLGECELLGVSVSKDHPLAPACVDALNTFYGRGDVPVGMVTNGVTPEERTFLRPVVEARDDATGEPLYPTTFDAYPEAVAMLRATLAAADDGSVVLVMIGFSTNAARLLDSPGDGISPLDGAALLARKCRRVVAMAGDFSPAVLANPTMETREYNVHKDAAAAQRFFGGCPVPVDFVGYEVGLAIPLPVASIERDYGWTPRHPVVDAYRAYRPMPYDRPNWDPAAVLAAVRPDAGHFTPSVPGRVRIGEEGILRFDAEPGGPHRYLSLAPDRRARALAEIVHLCARPVDAVTASPGPGAAALVAAAGDE